MTEFAVLVSFLKAPSPWRSLPLSPRQSAPPGQAAVHPGVQSFIEPNPAEAIAGS
jgi:hypothetical protein